LGGQFSNGFHACLADGSVAFISYETSEATLRAFITCNGGESIGERDPP
jgi:hypothetical protein